MSFNATSDLFGSIDFGKPYVLISDSSAYKNNDEYLQVGKQFARLVGKLIKEGLNIFFINTGTKTILKYAANITRTQIIPCDINILQATAILGSAQVLISGRFHPSIMASLGGTPCIMMTSNSHKSMAFVDYFRDIPGVPQKVFDAMLKNDVDIDEIVSETIRVISNTSLREEIKNRSMRLGELSLGLKDLL
jgi:exopolysaccharide biosynthesis predicted pyruvyltransferase EpsI